MSEDIFEEQKRLVLARFRTLNPTSEIILGDTKQVSVRDMILHIEKNDDFGKKVIQAQMRMLKVLAGTV
jgi:hypothetical protein